MWACVCVCVWYFTWWPLSWPAGMLQRSEGHCPQLVKSPTLRCPFVSIIKTPQGHRLQLHPPVSCSSEPEYILLVSVTCMKIDSHVTAVITRQSDKNQSAGRVDSDQEHTAAAAAAEYKHVTEQIEFHVKHLRLTTVKQLTQT